MSLTGGSQSWMVELQANVACILNQPATKQVPTSRGTLVVWAHITLAAISTAADTSNCNRVENLNFIRNMTAKLMARPTMEAYPAIRMSSCIRAVVPTMSMAAARYAPPENWMINTNSMNRYGLSRRGM